MKTALGEVAVGDAHVHFFSHRFFSALASQMADPPSDETRNAVLGQRLGWDFPEPDPARLAERWRAESMRQGVSRMVLIASVPGDEESVSVAVRAHPDRFAGYAMIDPVQPDAPARVGRALGDLKMRGVCLFPAMHGYRLDDPRLPPVLEAVRSRKGVVFVHCGLLRVPVRDKLGIPSRFDPAAGSPLALGSLARSFPDVPFVVPHFGCGRFEELLFAAAQCPNLYADTSSSNDWVKVLPYALDLAGVFRKALEVLGPARLLFGTDSSFFPRGWRKDVFEAQMKVLQSLKLPAADASRVLGGNLERLLAS